MNNLLIVDPLSMKDRKVPIQRVLNDLASQEGCDGDPYDQMVISAAYIDYLEAIIQQNITMDIIERLQKLVDKINKVGEEVNCKLCGSLLVGDKGCNNESCDAFCPF